MNIPFVDLSRQNRKLLNDIKKKLERIYDAGDFVLGKYVEDFEQAFAKYNGSRYCIGVASGTDALTLSLIALGIKKGDEVVVPAFTFSATVSPLMHLGIKPILVDILPNTPLIDIAKIDKAITKKTKAIIPVHLYGMMCDMSALKRLAKNHNLFLLEDACQAHGSEHKKKKAGSFGDIGIFSFYPSKNLGAFGDAGCIVTNNKTLAKKLYKLRNHGQSKKYYHEVLGFNSRLDAIQALVLKEKLKYLDTSSAQRRKVAKLYKKLLKNTPVKIITSSTDMGTNLHLFVIGTPVRDRLLHYMQKNGIACGIHYPYPIHLLPAFKELNKSKGDYPNAERLAKECLSIPLFPELREKEAIFIADVIKSFFTKTNN